MNTEAMMTILGYALVLGPGLLVAILGLSPLLNIPIGERTIARLTQWVVSLCLLASLALVGLMAAAGIQEVSINVGDWVALREQRFHFNVKFLFDRLSVPFLILNFSLCGVVGAFTTRYLHREPGFHRFFLFFSIFLFGMVVSLLAGTIETLFFGWELVGLSSALLVAYFHERPSPVRNGLRVWSVYRVSDAAFLVAAIFLHSQSGSGEFSGLIGSGQWPNAVAEISGNQAFVIGLLLLVAAAGKSALVPFSGWLPRAMEGPTPSSAVFYGALSVHLGAYLLLRVAPVIQASPPLVVIVCGLGLVTAVYATLAGRVQNDIKSALAFAALTQVGIIVFEIGLGLHYLALIHSIGHACLRTLQLLRAPTLLHDFHQMANAVGTHLKAPESAHDRLTPTATKRWLYRFSLERGYFDDVLDEFIAKPFIRFFRWSNRMETRWTDWLGGERNVVRDEAKREARDQEESK